MYMLQLISLNLKKKSYNYRKNNCFIIIQEIVKKHQNKKAPLIKKRFNCKKTGFVLTLHTHKMFA